MGDSSAESIIEKFGILKFPVYTVGGETTGMALSVPRRNDYELEIVDPVLLAQAKGLDGVFVQVKGEIYTKPGIEVPIREIIRVSSLYVPQKKLTCRGSNYLTEIYEQGFLAVVKKLDHLKGILSCLRERDFISCREPNLVDAGFRLESIQNKAFRLYELNFAGERQVDVLICDSSE